MWQIVCITTHYWLAKYGLYIKFFFLISVFHQVVCSWAVVHIGPADFPPVTLPPPSAALLSLCLLTIFHLMSCAY